MFIIIVVYLLLTLANRISWSGPRAYEDKIVNEMKKTVGDTNLEFLKIIDIINGETLEGVWEKSDTVDSAFLTRQNGIFSIKFERSKKASARSEFSVRLNIKNGDYID